MNKTVVAKYCLIFGLAAVFLFFGIDKFVHPEIWIGWIPSWMGGLEPYSWLQIIGATEILIGSLLLVPIIRVRKAACILAILEMIVVLTQVGWNDVGARDFGLLMMAAGLWSLLSTEHA